jgi:glyoxylase-like metal-dependent hydrolase (beta-lactamase superfamily II)
MQEISLSPRARAFKFDEIPDYYTCVFLIETDKYFFVLDTFAGSLAMEPVRDKIQAMNKDKEVLVINSHFHWDHVWGNLTFRDCKIVSHQLCREALISNWDDQIQNRGHFIQGETEPVFPSVVFETTLSFVDENIELIHTPGHTADSISVFDHAENSLYVFDNLERPIVYVEDPNIERYMETLRYYLALKPNRIFGSHTLELEIGDIHDTTGYLENLRSKKPVHFETDYEKRIHAENLAVLDTPMTT